LLIFPRFTLAPASSDESGQQSSTEPRQPGTVRHDIRESAAGGDLSERANFLFGLALSSGYTWSFQNRGSFQGFRTYGSEADYLERGDVCAELC